MNQQLTDVLENCLRRVEQGEPPDSVLETYPELAAQLRPLLEAAMRLRSANREPLPQAVLARQRARGLALAEELRQGKNHRPSLRRFWRLAGTVVCVIAILFMSSNGLFIASAESIPGDKLYPLKRSIESTQLQFVNNPVEKKALEQAFSERRISEAKSLLNMQRVETVQFDGILLSRSDAEWVIAGVPVIVTPQTEIEAGIVIGNEIDVRGSTNTAGHVVATRLSLDRDPDLDQDNQQVSPTGTPSSHGSDESVAPDAKLVPPPGEGEKQEQERSTSDDKSSSDENKTSRNSDSENKSD